MGKARTRKWMRRATTWPVERLARLKRQNVLLRFMRFLGSIT